MQLNFFLLNSFSYIHISWFVLFLLPIYIYLFFLPSDCYCCSFCVVIFDAFVLDDICGHIQFVLVATSSMLVANSGRFRFFDGHPSFFLAHTALLLLLLYFGVCFIRFFFPFKLQQLFVIIVSVVWNPHRFCSALLHF